MDAACFPETLETHPRVTVLHPLCLLMSVLTTGDNAGVFANTQVCIKLFINSQQQPGLLT